MQIGAVFARQSCKRAIPACHHTSPVAMFWAGGKVMIIPPQAVPPFHAVLASPWQWFVCRPERKAVLAELRGPALRNSVRCSEGLQAARVRTSTAGFHTRCGMRWWKCLFPV